MIRKEVDFMNDDQKKNPKPGDRIRLVNDVGTGKKDDEGRYVGSAGANAQGDRDQSIRLDDDPDVVMFVRRTDFIVI